VLESERQIAVALARTADDELTHLFEQARAEGRLDGVAMVIDQAAQAIHGALAPIVDAWCGATGHITGTVGRNKNGPGRRRGHGHPGYRPPAALQRLIQRRHSTCVFPTCNRKAIHCDLDHSTPYHKGGVTCRCNMSPLCRPHHRIFKQHRQWRLIQIWPGLLIWITPAGTWHIVLPE
ncbi:MAG TPA: HNH endonuclease signature motif containing protein, partial [Streptosporangiaceae bacterium]